MSDVADFFGALVYPAIHPFSSCHRPAFERFERSDVLAMVGSARQNAVGIDRLQAEPDVLTSQEADNADRIWHPMQCKMRTGRPVRLATLPLYPNVVFWVSFFHSYTAQTIRPLSNHERAKFRLQACNPPEDWPWTGSGPLLHVMDCGTVGRAGHRAKPKRNNSSIELPRQDATSSKIMTRYRQVISGSTSPTD